MRTLPPETPILVVDDSAGIRALMENYLQRLGFGNVRTAANLEEALNAFREQESEVVFLDLILDEETGADFAAEALAERPLATVVVTTALPTSHETVTAAIAEGAREFLPKPIRFNAVKSVLDHVARSKAEEEASSVEDVTYA